MAAILNFQSERFKLLLDLHHFDTSNEVWSQLAFWFRRKSSEYTLNMAATVTILDFQLERF